MEFDYDKITLEDIEMYSYFYFECDGDHKKVIAKSKKEGDE